MNESCYETTDQITILDVLVKTRSESGATSEHMFLVPFFTYVENQGLKPMYKLILFLVEVIPTFCPFPTVHLR